MHKNMILGAALIAVTIFSTTGCIIGVVAGAYGPACAPAGKIDCSKLEQPASTVGPAGHENAQPSALPKAQ